MTRKAKKTATGRTGKPWLVGLLVLALIVAPLTINAYLVASTTRPAQARDGGTVVATSVVPANVKVEGEGPPVVLIHGFGGAMDWWDEIAPALAAKHKVIRLDLIGHGGTEAPISGYAIDRQAALVAAVLDELGVDHAAVVGHAMGAEVATALAETRPELVERLVLIDPSPKAETAAKLAKRLSLPPTMGELAWQFTMPKDLRRALAQGFERGFKVPDKYLADIEQLTYRAFRAAYEGSLDYERAKPVAARLEALGGVPLLVLLSARDRDGTAESAAPYERIQGAKVVTVEGGGQSPIVEAPDKTLDLMRDFLAGQP
jgi:pimeloyl-ACP methyl ester carboxylesterase